VKYKMDHGNVVADLNYQDVASSGPPQPAPSSATKTDLTHFSPAIHEDTPVSHRGLASLDGPRAIHEHRNVGEAPLGQHGANKRWSAPRGPEGAFWSLKDKHDCAQLEHS
jgi:hypothetical protein